MRLYHGSPKLFETIIPQKARGSSVYQNQEAIFLTREFTRAVLYAIGKNLKGITGFCVRRDKLIILGDYKLADGYVYEFDISEKELVKGENTDEYSINKEITPVKTYKILAKDYIDYIIRVDTKEELFLYIETT